MLVCRLPEVASYLNKLDIVSKRTGEWGLGDNAFSAIQGDFVDNFIYTPREDSQYHCAQANHFATVRYAVETINASTENFRALNDQLRMFPRNMDRLLERHHNMSCLGLFVIRETQHDFPNNLSPFY